VGFREDDCRIRKDNAPQKFAILRHISLNLLNQEKTSKTGAKNKRLRAGWDDDYLTKLLAVTVIATARAVRTLSVGRTPSHHVDTQTARAACEFDF
jgi:hypothetical protein